MSPDFSVLNRSVSGEMTVSMATQLIVKLLRLWVPWQQNISHYIASLLVILRCAHARLFSRVHLSAESAVCCWGLVLGLVPPSGPNGPAASLMSSAELIWFKVHFSQTDPVAVRRVPCSISLRQKQVRVKGQRLGSECLRVHD